MSKNTQYSTAQSGMRCDLGHASSKYVTRPPRGLDQAGMSRSVSMHRYTDEVIGRVCISRRDRSSTFSNETVSVSGTMRDRVVSLPSPDRDPWLQSI